MKPKKNAKVKAAIADTENVNLDALWRFGGGDPKSSHGFSDADAARLSAAIYAPPKPWPELLKGPLTDTDAARYTDICAKDLRRAAAFIRAMQAHDASGMVANAGMPTFKLPDDKTQNWMLAGASWFLFVLHMSALMSFLRVAHPDLAAAWDKAVEPRIKNAGEAQVRYAKNLSDQYLRWDQCLRMTSSLTSAAMQVEEIHAALVRDAEALSIASKTKDIEPMRRGRKPGDNQPLRVWISRRSFLHKGEKTKRSLAETIAKQLAAVRPNGVRSVEWSAVERALKGVTISWSGAPPSRTAKVRWPH